MASNKENYFSTGIAGFQIKKNKDMFKFIPPKASTSTN